MSIWRWASLLLALAAAGSALAAPPATPLRPEQAYRYEVSADATGITVHWHILPSYYLYKERMSFASRSPDVQLGPAAKPAGLPHDDEFFGRMEIYRADVDVPIPVVRHAGNRLELEIRSQGCADIGLCYPPQVWTTTVTLGGPAMAGVPATAAAPTPPSIFGAQPARPGAPPPAETAGPGIGAPGAGVAPGPVAAAPRAVSEQDRLADLIRAGHIGWVMATFAGLGLLLAFTPCVLPMLPILSGIIVGQGGATSTTRAFLLSVTYVLGMAVTYTVAGALCAAAGQQIQAALQQPWIIVGVALLFVVLSLSMFGVYELQMPGALQTRLTAASSRQKAGSLVGTAAMGALSALVVTTCVAPPLVAALTVIAQTGDMVRGALALFALSMGMGIPLIVVGTSAGRLLPRAGVWMNAVKGAFGFMLLGVAIWMLERILPGAITLALWGVLIFVAAVFLGAFAPLGADAGAGRKLAKAAGLLGALWGAAMVAGALAGNQDPLQPLAGLGAARRDVTASGIHFERIKTVTDLDRVLSRGTPVMLDFYADWCVSCKEMERYTFRSPDVAQTLAGVALVQADVTANDAEDRALLARFGIFGPPTIVFFGADGREQPGQRVVGYLPAPEFAAHVRQALAGAAGK